MEVFTVQNLIKRREIASSDRAFDHPIINSAHTVSDLRYERKYAISGITLQETETIIKLNPAIFSPVYEQRFVNNIYLDTPFLHGFYETLAGVSHRKKTRIRWYGDMLGLIDKPVLEFKIKQGLAGYKISIPLASFTLKPPFTKGTLVELLSQSKVPASFKWPLDHLEPTLLNRYLRNYYLSGDKRYRATIDTRLSFHKIYQHSNLHLQSLSKTDLTVVELKYDCKDDNDVDFISSAFPFRLSKSSKYVMGIDLLLR